MKKILQSIIISAFGIILFGIFLFFILPSERGVDFEVTNISTSPIEHVRLYTSERISIIELGTLSPNEQKKGFLPMEDNRTDGAYIIEFNRPNTDKETQQSGYYSNGKPTSRTVKFIIQDRGNL